jgi:hypothetical protein
MRRLWVLIRDLMTEAKCSRTTAWKRLRAMAPLLRQQEKRV